MEINFKTLDKQKFSLFTYGSEYVEDLINKVENTIGKDNLYRLIHAGRLLKKETLVSEYNLSPVLPVIFMVTEPEQKVADDDNIEEKQSGA